MNNILKALSENIDSFNNIRVNSHNQEISDISLFSLKQTYINSRECPHCNSHHVYSNGNYKGRKRYICQSCGKSFNDLTNTPFSGIHNMGKMMEYLKCMISGETIRGAAYRIDVSVTTSFAWRHKLLNRMKHLSSPKMKNVKEVIELKIPYSHKGQRTRLTVEQSNSKISALFVCDRTGKLDSDSIRFSDRKKNPLIKRIYQTSNNHTDLILSTKFNNIIDFSASNIKYPNSTYTKTDTVKHIVSLWQLWMKRFHGVASKYLSNYLHWFDYLDNSLYSKNIVPDLIQLLLKH